MQNFSVSDFDFLNDVSKNSTTIPEFTPFKAGTKKGKKGKKGNGKKRKLQKWLKWDEKRDGKANFSELANSITPATTVNNSFESLEDSILTVDLTIPQLEFFNIEESYALFVGGFGSGKSLAMALCALRDLINFPGANVACYAPTYGLLNLINIPFIENLLVESGYPFSFNQRWHFFDVEGYGKIICRSYDKPERIVGYETFRSHCDEIDILPDDKADFVWKKVIARNRQKVFLTNDDGTKIPKIDEKTKEQIFTNGKPQFLTQKNGVRVYTTPEGWKFAYKKFEKKEGVSEELKDQYRMVRASTYSNEHNLPSDYIENLRGSYSPELVEAYIEGRFTNLTSGRVYRFFDRFLNASYETVLDDDDLFIGMDFNVEVGAAVIHVERLDKLTGKTGDHAVDEISNSFDTDETIDAIIDRYPEHYARKKIIVYPDASGVKRSSSGIAVNTKGQATKTDMYKIKKHFRVRVDRSNPRIKDRVFSLSARICNAKKERNYFVNINKCPSLTETLEKQTWSNGLPDKSEGLDHHGDCAGYVIHKKYPVSKPRAGFLRA